MRHCERLLRHVFVLQSADAQTPNCEQIDARPVCYGVTALEPRDSVAWLGICIGARTGATWHSGWQLRVAQLRTAWIGRLGAKSF